MDLAVAAVLVVSETRILAQTTVPGDAVDAADPRDLLASQAWVLVGESPPLVSQVVPQDPVPPRSAFFLDLDAPLVPGRSYTLALAPLARSAHGEPTSTVAVGLVGGTPRARTGAVPGEPAADVALPVLAQNGAPRGLAPLDALRERIRLLVRARRGSFTHAPTFGRGVEPKRSYSDARLQQEARALREEIARDPDVRSASVAYDKRDHLVRFEVTVEPRQGQAFVVTERLTAGEEA